MVKSRHRRYAGLICSLRATARLVSQGRMPTRPNSNPVGIVQSLQSATVNFASIPAFFLGAVQREISLLDQFLETVAINSGISGTHAERQAVRGRQARHGEVDNHLPKSLENIKYLVFTGIGHYQQKFLSTKAPEDVIAAQVALTDIGKGNQDRVADIMSVAVVDAFEMVQIKDGNE